MMKKEVVFLKIYKYYDESEEAQIEEKICNRFKELIPLVNKVIVKREYDKY